jgi:hypothetical protein
MSRAPLLLLLCFSFLLCSSCNRRPKPMLNTTKLVQTLNLTDTIRKASVNASLPLQLDTRSASSGGSASQDSADHHHALQVQLISVPSGGPRRPATPEELDRFLTQLQTDLHSLITTAKGHVHSVEDTRAGDHLTSFSFKYTLDGATGTVTATLTLANPHHSLKLTWDEQVLPQ